MNTIITYRSSSMCTPFYISNIFVCYLPLYTNNCYDQKLAIELKDDFFNILLHAACIWLHKVKILAFKIFC